MAIGDFNNDGAIDVLISVNNAAPVLLRNNVGAQNHWLGIRLVGKKSNIDAVGARITYQAQDLKRSRMKVGGGSYLSDHDPRIVLGIGKRTKIDWLEVKWPMPSGATEREPRSERKKRVFSTGAQGPILLNFDPNRTIENEGFSAYQDA